MPAQSSALELRTAEAILCRGAEVIRIEADALNLLAESLQDSFVEACEAIFCARGRTVITGMGKSGHIGRKWAATMAATGTPAIYVHPAEAAHGDLGMLVPGDRPRPSTLDLLASLRADGCVITSVVDFEERTLGYEATIDRWLDRAAVQLGAAVNSAIAWIDPAAVRLSSPLPKSILDRLADRLNDGLIVWGDHRGDCEIPSFDIEVSSLGSASSALGAALLPIHASIARG